MTPVSQHTAASHRRFRRSLAAGATAALLLTGAATGAFAAGPKPTPPVQHNGTEAHIPANTQRGISPAAARAITRAAASSPASTRSGSSTALPPDQTGGPSAGPPSTDAALEPVDLGSLPQSAAALDDLRSAARRDGSVHVLVTLATRFTALGSLTASAAGQQRATVQRLSAAAAELAVAHGGTVVHTYDGNVPAIALTATPDTLDALAGSPAVARIDADGLNRPSDSVTTPLVGAADAQDRGFHGANTEVAILDTGVEYGHPYLGGRVAHAGCFSAASDCPNGQTSQIGGTAGIPCTFATGCNHGTHVAGDAAGQTTSGHVGGVADQARIESVRIFHLGTCPDGSACPYAYDSDIIAGLNFVYDTRGIGTVSANMSLGGGMYTSNCDSDKASIKTAVDNLRSVNIATAIAAGNDGYTNAVSSPGCISTALTVGATDNNDAVAYFSNSSAQVDMYAPGYPVESSVPGGGYAYFSGTSMATPIVAGSIAVIRSLFPGFSVSDVEFYLETTGKSVTDSKSGLVRQRINVLQAMGQETVYLANDGVRDLRNPIPYDHLFATDSTSFYWSAVAVRPPAGADDDLYVYDNADRTGALAGSSASGDVVDFVAQDSNRRAYPDYTYPVVHQFAGSGRYQIEYANDTTSVVDSTVGIAMTSPEIVEVRDSQQLAGVPTYYRVVPSSSSQDPELFLMQSTEGSPATYVQGRGAAVTTASANGPGGEESMAYTSPVTQYDGLVLINRSGSGTYTLYRDTTAPPTSMTIGAGDPGSTNTRANTLSISASDPQTAIRDMRIVTDGTPDSEPWIPYASTAPVTLTGPAGTKTVQVQVRNNANMVSTVADTITLDTRPNYRVTATSNPPATTTRGGSFSVTDTTKNVGLSAASAPSTNRYYLSLNTVYNAGVDPVLSGSRGVPALGTNGASSTGSATVTVPATVARGSYYVITCADAANTVDEFSDADNCRASAGKVSVQVADYIIGSLSNPPSSRARGTTFPETDVTKNIGDLAATASSRTRYYLSVDAVRDASDRVLTPARLITALAAGGSSTGTTTVTIPSTGLSPGTYRVLACADDLGNTVDESIESNNCRAAATSITVS